MTPDEIKWMKSVSKPSHSINGYCEPKDIVDVSAAKYKHLYNSVSSDVNSMFEIKDYINDNLQNSYNGDIISLETVTAAIKRLKYEKNDGNC